MKKKIELLSPAGDFESLKSAIHNGADAVYISGKNYGARKFATNFTLEEIEQATKYCHLYDVKIYVTINTIIYENEIEDFMNYVKTIHGYGIDAVIMQDIGMIYLVHKTFPNLEIHASTQVHTHNNEGLLFLEKLGVKRAVLARELSLSEIKSFTCPIEKEVFIHGALCVSYSGECLLSSLELGRSGNRGECAGLCRLPYELLKAGNKINTKEKYLLSMKELSSINNLKQILDTDVSSLKIEGRMKSATYVGYVTKIYRKLIDAYYNNDVMQISDKEYKNLCVLYNREFTKGFIGGEDKSLIVNSKTPNHQGIILGKVISISDKIGIKLTEDLNQGDGIRLPNGEGMIANFIYNKSGLLINGSKKGKIVFLDNKCFLKEKGIVLKTYDNLLEEALTKYELKKIPIIFEVVAMIGKPLTISINDGLNMLCEQSIILDKANKIIVTEDDIKEKLNKLGNTPYMLKEMNIKMDKDVFVPLKELNNLRRVLTDKLSDLRESVKKEVIINDYQLDDYEQNISSDISFLVRNETQLKYLINKNVLIYVEDKALYNKYRSNKVFYKLPRVNIDLDSLESEQLVVCDLGSLNKYNKNNTLVGDTSLNIVNSNSVKALKYLSIKKICLSLEMNDEQIKEVVSNLRKTNLELIIYGRPEVMVLKYCPISSTKGCSSCIKNNNYSLRSQSGKTYPLISNNCITSVLHATKINLLDKIQFYKELGITNFRIDLYDESEKELSEIIEKLKKYGA